MSARPAAQSTATVNTMRDEPLKAALDAMRIAVDKVTRAQTFYDYLGKDPLCESLSTMRASLVQFQTALQQMSTDIHDLNNRTEDSL